PGQSQKTPSGDRDASNSRTSPARYGSCSRRDLLRASSGTGPATPRSSSPSDAEAGGVRVAREVPDVEPGHAAECPEPEEPVGQGRVSPDVGDEGPAEHEELEDHVGERLQQAERLLVGCVTRNPGRGGARPSAVPPPRSRPARRSPRAASPSRPPP